LRIPDPMMLVEECVCMVAEKFAQRLDVRDREPSRIYYLVGLIERTGWDAAMYIKVHEQGGSVVLVRFRTVALRATELTRQSVTAALG
jgi:hypothetical protein